MIIQLKDWKVTKLNLTHLEAESRRDKNSFDLEVGSYFSDDSEIKIFGIKFNLTINDKAFDLYVESTFHFELVGEKITEEFKLSLFPKINAPAIAFPYLRAFVSNLTLQSGFEPVILPSINFVNSVDIESE